MKCIIHYHSINKQKNQSAYRVFGAGVVAFAMGGLGCVGGIAGLVGRSLGFVSMNAGFVAGTRGTVVIVGLGAGVDVAEVVVCVSGFGLK
jgi:hypothetical protein